MYVSYGNRKLPNYTAVMNIGSAKNCPSKALGMCNAVACGVTCYAEKAEVLYKAVFPCRERNSVMWLSMTTTEAIFTIMASVRKKKVKYFRINESGDFYSQECVQKMDDIAKALITVGIKLYDYTSRSDLDYSKISFTLYGSGFYKKGLTGYTDIITDKHEKIGFVCPGSCKTCNVCAEGKKAVVLFKKH